MPRPALLTVADESRWNVFAICAHPVALLHVPIYVLRADFNGPRQSPEDAASMEIFVITKSYG